MTCCQGLFVGEGFGDLGGICTKFQVWLDTIGYVGINLKDLQPQSGIYKEKIRKTKMPGCLAWLGDRPPSKEASLAKSAFQAQVHKTALLARRFGPKGPRKPGVR